MIAKILIVFLVAGISVRAFAQGWELTEDEKNALREGAICYSIDRPGRFERDPRVYAAGTTLEKAGAVGNLPFYVTPNGFLDAVSGKRGAVDSYTDHIQTGMENNPFFSPLR